MFDQQNEESIERIVSLDVLNKEEQALFEQAVHLLRMHHKEHLLIKQILGFHVNQIEKDKAIISMPIHDSLSNGRNMVHGGIIAALADAAMGILAAAVTGDEKSAVTAQLSISYIATGRGKFLEARVEAVHIGRRSLVIDCVIVNDAEKLIAKAEATFFIVPKGY
ncbi:MAG: PaaI family thioesterase [Sporolactobacillus sp.]